MKKLREEKGRGAGFFGYFFLAAKKFAKDKPIEMD